MSTMERFETFQQQVPNAATFDSPEDLVKWAKKVAYATAKHKLARLTLVRWTTWCVAACYYEGPVSDQPVSEPEKQESEISDAFDTFKDKDDSETEGEK